MGLRRLFPMRICMSKLPRNRFFDHFTEVLNAQKTNMFCLYVGESVNKWRVHLGHDDQSAGHLKQNVWFCNMFGRCRATYRIVVFICDNVFGQATNTSFEDLIS